MRYLKPLIVANEVFSENVIAETVGGSKDSVLVIGGHSDSVFAGPGINDDGSGIIGLLEVAEQLTGYGVNNSVRLGFWAGEEFGLLGSYYYTENLTAEEASKIRLYLNFDMIASPNYIYGIYDGDGSAFNQSGPAGSAEAEAFFEDFFDAASIMKLCGTSSSEDCRSCSTSSCCIFGCRGGGASQETR